MTLSHKNLVKLAFAAALAIGAVGFQHVADPVVAEAADPMKQFVGKIITSPKTITVTDDVASFPAYLKSVDKDAFTTVKKRYTINILAFFKKPVGASQCQVVLYRKDGKKWKFVNNIPHTITAEQTTLLSVIELNKAEFADGDYEVRVTLLKRGKEQVFARKKISLN